MVNFVIVLFLFHLEHQVNGIPKRSAEDTTLHVMDSSGRRKPIFVPKGADIVLHTAGLHYNRTFYLAGSRISCAGSTKWCEHRV